MAHSGEATGTEHQAEQDLLDRQEHGVGRQRLHPHLVEHARGDGRAQADGDGDSDQAGEHGRREDRHDDHEREQPRQAQHCRDESGLGDVDDRLRRHR